MKNAFLFSVLTALALYACTGRNQTVTDSDSLVKDYELKELWATDTLLKSPESVLYDELREVLYVANINGVSNAKDGNGFISRLSTEGDIIELEWVKGLNGPKGMGVFGNLLYVADITDLVIIDIEEGKVIQTVPVDSAVFLNDIAIDAAGKVYFTDSRRGKILTYSDSTVSEWLTGLANPNGLYAEESRILFLTSSLNSVDTESNQITLLTDSIGHGDGLAFTGISGFYLTSDWTGEVFLIYPDYSKKSLLQTRDQKKNTADIYFIPEDKLLLVPTFFDNRLVAYELVPIKE